jgi:hypothetical protein
MALQSKLSELEKARDEFSLALKQAMMLAAGREAGVREIFMALCNLARATTAYRDRLVDVASSKGGAE